MSKKKIVNSSSKRKPSSKAAAAKRKVEIVENYTAKDVITEIDPKEASAVETTAKAFPKAETAAAATAESPSAKPTKASGQSAPKEEPEETAGQSAPKEEPAETVTPEERYISPRRSVAFIGSECYPFVKTGGLGDVMYALPKALVKQN